MKLMGSPPHPACGEARARAHSAGGAAGAGGAGGPGGG